MNKQINNIETISKSSSINLKSKIKIKNHINRSIKINKKIKKPIKEQRSLPIATNCTISNKCSHVTFQLSKVKKHVIGGSQFRRRSVDLATRLLQFSWRQKFATLIALIATSVVVRAMRALYSKESTLIPQALEISHFFKFETWQCFNNITKTKSQHSPPNKVCLQLLRQIDRQESEHT